MTAPIRDTDTQNPAATLAKVKVIAAGYGMPTELVDALVSSAKAVTVAELQPTIVKAIEEGITQALAEERAAVGSVIETLKTGWRAMLNLEKHAAESVSIPFVPFGGPPSPWCPDCGRFAAALLRGEKPSEVLHLRCEDAQGWQRQVEAANRLVFGDARPPCCDMHNEHCEPPSELCCRHCTEAKHDTFPIRHADGSRCVLGAEPGQGTMTP